MTKKTIEDLILDFIDRYESKDIIISFEKRKIDDNHIMLWFKAKALIIVEDFPKEIMGESYTILKSLGELHKIASMYKKPKIFPKREHVRNHTFGDIENIVQYREKQ